MKLSPTSVRGLAGSFLSWPVVSLLLALTLSPGLLRAQNQEQQRAAGADHIEVAAQGQVTVDPDTALVNFVFSAQNRDLKAAYRDVQTQTEKARGILRQQGFAPASVQWSGYQVQPNFDWHSHKLIDYSVSQNGSLEVTDFLRVGALVDALGSAGLSGLRDVTFELKNSQPARDRAVAQAFVRARGEAAALAQAASRSLGRLNSAAIDLNEGGIRPLQMRFRAASAEAAPPPPMQGFTPQQITVTATVRASFILNP